MSRTHILTMIKLAIAMVILYLLLTNNSIQFQPLAAMLVGKPHMALLGAILLMSGLLVGALRWLMLLRTAGIPINFSDVMRLQLIGAFFSTWLPGAAGGDAARALYLVKSLQSRRTTALLTIALDRTFALFGLLAVAAMLVLSSWQNSTIQPVLTYYIWLITATILVGVVGGLTAFSVARYVKVPVLPRWVTKARPFAHQLREAVVLIVGHWVAMVSCATLSIIASGLVALGMVVISIAFPFSPTPIIAALAGVIGNISSAIPLTPGGLGIGEAAFAKICLELGSRVAPYATIYLAFRIVMAAVSFSGVFFWLTHREIK